MRTLILGLAISLSPIWSAIVLIFVNLFTIGENPGFSATSPSFSHIKEIIAVLGVCAIITAYWLKKKNNTEIENIIEKDKCINKINTSMINQMMIAYSFSVMGLVYSLMWGQLYFALVVIGVDIIAMLGLIPSKKLLTGN